MLKSVLANFAMIFYGGKMTVSFIDAMIFYGGKMTMSFIDERHGHISTVENHCKRLKGIQFCSDEKPRPFLRGDNQEIVKIY